MKIRLAAFGLIALVVAGFIMTRNAISQDAKQDATGIDAVMKSPNGYKGVIKIEGAVSEVYPKDNFIVLIDRKEYKQCGKETCALLKLPVKWSGPMPSVRDIIVARGEIRENRGLRFFSATTLEKIPVQALKEQ